MSIEILRQLIGRAVTYQGLPCCIVEVLEDVPALVLVDHRGSAVQSNQYGAPYRSVPQTFTVQVLESDGVSLHEDFRALVITPEPCRQ